jgi:hypothetical protein
LGDVLPVDFRRAIGLFIAALTLAGFFCCAMAGAARASVGVITIGLRTSALTGAAVNKAQSGFMGIPIGVCVVCPDNYTNFSPERGRLLFGFWNASAERHIREYLNISERAFATRFARDRILGAIASATDDNGPDIHSGKFPAIRQNHNIEGSVFRRRDSTQTNPRARLKSSGFELTTKSTPLESSDNDQQEREQYKQRLEQIIWIQAGFLGVGILFGVFAAWFMMRGHWICIPLYILGGVIIIFSGTHLTPPYRFSENIGIKAIVIAELEFRDVQREVFGADLVERADNAPLEDRPEAFNGLSVDGAANILPGGMVNCLMREISVEVLVTNPFVGAEQAHLVGNDFANELFECRGANVADNAGDDITFALDSASHNGFAGAARPAFAASALIFMPVLGLPADEGFVHFDNAHELAEFLVSQPGADARAHIPSRFEGAEPECSMDLTGGNALFAGEHQVDDPEPIPERDFCVLEDRSGDMGKAIGGALFRALVALPAVSHRAVFADLGSAAWACNPIRPAVTDQIGAARIFVRKGLLPLGEGHLVDLGLLFLAGHSGSPCGQGEYGMPGLTSQQAEHRPN